MLSTRLTLSRLFTSLWTSLLLLNTALTSLHCCLLLFTPFNRRLVCNNWTDIFSPGEWRCDVDTKTKFAPKNVQQWQWSSHRDHQIWQCRRCLDEANCSHMQHIVASMFVSLKLRGTVRCLTRARKGPRLSQNEALMVTELPGCQTISSSEEPSRGLWGPQSPWWRWCRPGCKSSWRRAWRVGRRADSRWRCSSRSQVSERKRKWHRVERRRWCAPCCSGPAASASPGNKNWSLLKFGGCLQRTKLPGHN